MIGVAKIAGGATLIGMTGGAGAPAGIGLMASGGQDIVNDIATEGANKSIEKAVGQQQQATNQALGLQQQALTGQNQIYQQSQANLSPYQQLGTSGAQGVASMMGYPAIQLPPIASGMPSSPGAAASQPAQDVAVPRDGAVRRPEAKDAVQTAQAQTASSFGGTLGSMGVAPVTLRAPNGAIRQFAPDDPAIQHYLSTGAQVA